MPEHEDPTRIPEQTEEQPRQGTLERTKEEGFGGLLKGLGSMLLPQAGLPGKRGLGNILNDFVEFGSLGDIGDIGAALDPNSGLDPLERLIAASPFLGVGAIGTRQAYKSYQKRHVQSQAQTARSMMPPPDQPIELEAEFEDLAGPAATAEEARQQAAHFERLALEADSPFARATFDADTWEDLVSAVLLDDGFIPEGAHEIVVHPPLIGDLRARMEATLRGIGAAVIAITPVDPEFYGSDFVAAKTAVSKYVRAMEMEMIDNPSDRTAREQVSVELFGANSVDNAVKIAQLEAALWMVGPDLSLSSPARLSRIWWIEDTNEIQVAYVMVDGLLPTERGFDHDTGYPIDTDIIRRGQQQLDMEGQVGVGATHVAQALLETPPHPGDVAGGVEATIRMDFYPMLNSTARALSEVTPYTVEQVMGVLAAMSAQTPWIPDNLVGAVHVILQTGLPDMVPGSAEYIAAFKQVTLNAGWGFDLFDQTSPEITAPFEQSPTDPTGGIPDLEGLTEFFADPENVTSPEGNLVGAADQVKKDKIDMILKGNLPPWIVLRGMKTNTFSQVGADPSLIDLVVIDVWNDRIWWGTRWVDTPLAHDGYTAKTEIKPDETYHDPISGDTVKGDKILEGLNTLREDHDWTDLQVERWVRLLTSYPTRTAQARFLAQAKSHLLVRDVFGLEAAHQAQAGSWGTAREKWGALDKEIDGAKTQEELREVAERGNLSTVMFSHIDGNPSMELTAAGMIWNLTSIIPQKIPSLKELNAVQKGMQRQAAGRASGGIIAVTGVDGQVAVYADTSVNGVAETLRHATPSGVMVGPYELYIASEPRQVTEVETHFADTAEYLREDGRPAAGHQTMIPVDPKYPGHPGSRAGDTAVLLLPPDQVDTANRILDSDYGFDRSTVNARSTVTGLSRNPVIAEDLEGMSSAQLGEVLQNNDWVAISAVTEGATDGANWENMRLLKLDIERAGGTIVDGEGVYEGSSEASYFVTGMTYADAVRLGTDYGQSSVATRNGLLFMDETYRPVQEGAAFGENANPENHTVLSTGQKFSFDYDFKDVRNFPEDIDTLADVDPQNTPLTQMTVGMGGQYGGATWNITDRVLKQLAAIPGARLRFYTHSQNKIPSGFTTVTESVVTDATGVTGSTLHKGGDVYARHQNAVYVPEWEALTLSEDGFGGERTRRETVDVRSILEIDEQAGMIWIDKDLVIMVDPEADVTLGKQGNLFGSLRVNGNLVRTIVVDTNGPVPTIEVGLDALPAPGRTVVELSRGKATKIIPHGEGDWTAAKEALTGVGLIPSGTEVKVSYPEANLSILEDSTYRVTYEFGRGLVLAQGQPSTRPVVPDDLVLTESLQEWLPALKRVNLGKNAHPDLRGILEETLEGLHGRTNRYPGVKLVGPLSDQVWKNSTGIDTVHIINEPETTALTVLEKDGGIVFNERNMHVRWNRGVSLPKPTYMIKPDNMTDFESTLIHEMGHLASRHLHGGQMHDLVLEANDAMGSVVARLNMSEYGLSADAEFIAEAFVEVMAKGEQAHPALVKLVKTIVERDGPLLAALKRIRDK